jgi:hypothetical protein
LSHEGADSAARDGAGLRTSLAAGRDHGQAQDADDPPQSVPSQRHHPHLEFLSAGAERTNGLPRIE